MNKVFPVLVAAALVCGCVVDKTCKKDCRCGGEMPTVKHVVLFGVDGMGARWMPWKVMPNLSKLSAEGHYAVGRCSFPTASGINWGTTMFGTVVEIHGYRKWNSRSPDVPAFEVTDRGIPPCIFHEIKKQDPSAYTVSLYNWDGIGFVHATNEVDYVRYFGEGTLEGRDDIAVEECLAQMKAHKPKLTFLYQHLPDCYGHKSGWGSEDYTNACIHVDQNLGKLVKGLEDLGMRDDTVIILMADHGGLGRKHGMDILECFEVPFMVNGPAVNNGFRLREPVLLSDTAPTIATLLGYKVPETWRGRSAIVPR